MDKTAGLVLYLSKGVGCSPSLSFPSGETRGSGETSYKGAVLACGGEIQSVGSYFFYSSIANCLGLCGIRAASSHVLRFFQWCFEWLLVLMRWNEVRDSVCYKVGGIIQCPTWALISAYCTCFGPCDNSFPNKGGSLKEY